jgi:outer membrane protein assembly factor BamB
MIVAYFATSLIIDKSIATAGMGMMFPLLVIPVLSLAFVASVVATRRLSDGHRRATIAASIVLGCGVWALVRIGGFAADGDIDFAWRWAETSEERLVAQAKTEPIVHPTAPTELKTSDEQLVTKTGDQAPAFPASSVVAESAAEWPGFRGPDRNSIIRGVRIETNWSASPPVELWRRPIGPGWSSFAVHGNLFYTQEQRGDEEVVSCYSMKTGEPVWLHRDSTRFWEANGGAGPRGTPTLSNGRVYTLGGTGILNALDARDGSVLWSRNAASDTKKKTPYWGFSGSPLVLDDLVIVAASGALAAYDLATGNPRWFGPDSGTGYSSPHLVTIDGVMQILQLNKAGLVSVMPSDGTLLWEHSWAGYPIVQPALTVDGDVLISVADQSGLRRLAVAHDSSGWTVEERWTSKGLKPYFNDFVVHNGHAYGIDGSIISCIDLKDGKRKWKGGRYGAGQLFLLADQDLLLVLSEQGELALVKATPDNFTEVARFPAIEGKTWNHPALVGDVLLVRNGEEMVAFRLAIASS